jgi:hypothetical protein
MESVDNFFNGKGENVLNLHRAVMGRSRRRNGIEAGNCASQSGKKISKQGSRMRFRYGWKTVKACDHHSVTIRLIRIVCGSKDEAHEALMNSCIGAYA